MSLPINHRVLHVDLTERSVWTEQPDETFYRRFVGGRGMIAHQLLTAVPPDADPLGPENQLVFALGPLTGIAFPGNARFSVGAKSPLTGLYGEAEAGGFWPAELKRAGWDGIVVEGRATGPVYVWIHDDQVEIRDARHLWGKITGDAEDAIRAELGERRARIAQIGPAGENLVRYACIMNDLNEAAGRTGLGAVMGSKRLKAIAVRGTQVVQPVAGTLFKETARQVAANLSSDYLSLHTYGTGVALEAGKHREGHLIVHNFRDGRMETVRNIDANAIHDNVLEKMDACYACSVRCKKRVRIENGASVDPRYGGPEYEAIGALGSNLAVDDLVALCKSNELCNAYGLDAISTGGAIGWAMELYEVGLLTDEDTGGEPLRWGSGEDVLRLVDQITYRRGIGDLLAEGVLRAARDHGRGSERYAVHVKGLEVGMHDPRAMPQMLETYPVTPVGGDHTSASKKNASLCNTLGLCLFLNYSDEQKRELLNAATGWEMGEQELDDVFERGLALTRLFNLREGLTAADDCLPQRFHEPIRHGPLKDEVLSREAVAQIVRAYYVEHGWNPETGDPTPETRARLAIADPIYG